ncbi:MAG: GtrA family protein, partial [Gammaproteobacteria bacterium]|nr:GtrA family protein [Gammaproteobacteria bacterium]
ARKIGQFSIKRFRSITDCTSGFFGLNRDVIHNVTLNPDSWKILMEILVKGKYKTVGEIPYHFMARDLGDSKMSSKEQLHYLWHIIKLICVSPQDRRFYLFCFVGVLGVFINLLAFHLFLKIPLHPLLASVYASAIAIVHNFLWHDNLTWKDHKHVLKLKRAWQFSKFILVSCVGIVITAGVVKCFLEFKLNLLFGQLSGIALCTFWSYFANHTWTWKKK